MRTKIFVMTKCPFNLKIHSSYHSLKKERRKRIISIIYHTTERNTDSFFISYTCVHLENSLMALSAINDEALLRFAIAVKNTGYSFITPTPAVSSSFFTIRSRSLVGIFLDSWPCEQSSRKSLGSIIDRCSRMESTVSIQSFSYQ